MDQFQSLGADTFFKPKEIDFPIDKGKQMQNQFHCFDEADVISASFISNEVEFFASFIELYVKKSFIPQVLKLIRLS